MQIGWMEDDFRNQTAKVWANLDNPIKRYDFSKVSLILCISPSQVALFMKMYLPSSFIRRYVRAEMNVHAFMNELDQT